ncbi:hypothetical protein QTP70_031676, partial [Hemibagrus guttatus]
RLYFDTFQKAYQAPSWDEILQDIQQHIHKYNSEHGEDCVAVDTKNGQVVVAICTPFMKNVHARITESGDVLLINSFWSCDDKNLKVCVLLCHYAERGLPLGVIITSAETKSTISAGLQLLKTLIPSRNFFRCHGGPWTIALSEDCTPLRQALQEAYPEASFLLCAFYLMQEMRQWLKDSSPNITKSERTQLLDLFRKMVSARCEDFLQSHYDTIRSNPLAAKHSEFIQHLEETYKRRETWAACFQEDLPSSYAVFAKRILKDKVLHQLKAFNLIQMVHFVQTRMESHYIRQLTLAVNDGNQPDVYVSEAAQSNIVQNSSLLQLEVTNLLIYQSGKGYKAISKALGLLRTTVRAIIYKWRKHGTVENLPRSGRPTKITPRAQPQLIQEVPKDPTTTSKELQASLASVKHDEENYTVGVTSDIQYHVNITLMTCTCPMDVATGSCEHLNIVRRRRLQEMFYEITNNTDSTIKQEIIKPDTSNADVGGATNGETDTQASQTPAGTSSRLVEDLMQVFDSVRDKVLNDPHTFTLPVQRFISHYKNMKSDSDLVSALSVFGKRTCRWTSLRKAAAGGNGTLSTGRLLKRIRREHNYPSWTKKKTTSQNLELCMDQSMTQNREENKP